MPIIENLYEQGSVSDDDRCEQVLEYYRKEISNCLKNNNTFEFLSGCSVTTIKIMKEYIPSGLDYTYVGGFGHDFT